MVQQPHSLAYQKDTRTPVFIAASFTYPLLYEQKIWIESSVYSLTEDDTINHVMVVSLDFSMSSHEVGLWGH